MATLNTTSDNAIAPEVVWTLVGCAVIALVWGAWSFRARSDRDLPLRLVGALLPVGLFSVAVALTGVIAEAPWRDWSGSRLAWSAGLLHGYGLYSGPDSGPVLSSIYGPVSPLLFVPAMLTGEITSAMLLGLALNVGIVLSPLLVVALHGSRGDPGRRAIGWAVFVCAVAAVLVMPSTRNLTHNIHVDGAAVALGLLSCVLLFGDKAPSSGRLWASTALTALAVWTKQVEITLGMAQALYIWLAFGWAAVVGFVWRLAAFGFGLAAVFVAAFGFDGMWFHMWTIPSGHPMATHVQLDPERIEFPPNFRLIVKELVLWGAPFVALIGVVQLATPRGVRRWLRQDWALLLLVAAILFPTSVLARAKVGGWINSYHTHYFLVAAAIVCVVQFFAREGVRPRAHGVLAAVMLVAVPALWCPIHLDGLHRLHRLPDNPQREAYDYAVAHPGEAWFPWHPLSMLMAEGKLYHFYWAMVDRDISGNKMSSEHVDAHMPARMRYVIHNRARILDRDPMPYLPRYLPDYRNEIELPELPGWTVLTK